MEHMGKLIGTGGYIIKNLNKYGKVNLDPKPVRKKSAFCALRIKATPKNLKYLKKRVNDMLLECQLTSKSPPKKIKRQNNTQGELAIDPQPTTYPPNQLANNHRFSTRLQVPVMCAATRNRM
jgi:hypothetical protein